MIDAKIFEAVAAQEPDGYLGALPKYGRLLGPGVNGSNWDLSNMYHLLTAFIEYHELTGDEVVLRSAMHLCDLLCEIFGPGKATIQSACPITAQCNWGVIAPLTRMYRLTGRERYLTLAESIIDEWENPNGGSEWVRLALEDKRLTEMHGIHALEMIFCFEGALDLWEVNGDERLYKAGYHWWREMAERETMAHGNLAPEELWRNNPYSPSWAETCVATAYMRLTNKVLCLTGEMRCADALEQTLLNAYLGAQQPESYHWCYPVPVNGVKQWGVYELKPEDPDMGCCFNYALTGMGLIQRWGTMLTRGEEPALVVNYYGAGVAEVSLDGQAVRLEQRTQYPAGPEVELTVHVERAAGFPLWLRVPAWSAETRVEVNGKGVKKVVAGEYLKIERNWRDGDRVRLVFDFSPRVVRGQGETEAMAAIYRGPILLALDQRFNPELNMKNLPQIDVAGLALKPIEITAEEDRPWVLVEAPTADGRSVVLCDFASAGCVNGSEYAGWIPAVFDAAKH